VRGENVDHRGDLYSVGVLAYELLTGRLPFDRPNSMDMLLAHATELPPAFAELNLGEEIPTAVEAVVMKCLEKDAANRPQTARDLAAAFDRALAESTPASPDVPPSLDTPLPSRFPEKPFQAHFTAAPDDPHALLLSFKAWMPEKVALIKLRGYCHDFRGEIVESQPGLVRVLLPTSRGNEPTNGGPLSWLGLARRPCHTHLELRLIQDDPQRENLLTIEARFRPGEGSSIGSESWRGRCVQHFINLRGYLMGQVESV
jgi:serine/threonine-protein kinase